MQASVANNKYQQQIDDEIKICHQQKRELKDIKKGLKSVLRVKKENDRNYVKILHPENIKLNNKRKGLIFFLKKTAANRDKGV